MLVAISRKHCLHKLSPYFLLCAPIRPHRLHFRKAMPVVLSFGALCFLYLANFTGLCFSCLNTFRKSLVVMLVLYVYFEVLLHKGLCLCFSKCLLLPKGAFPNSSSFNPMSRLFQGNTYLQAKDAHLRIIGTSFNINIFWYTKGYGTVIIKLTVS